ncbi:hypothetical protein L211DRAFT_638185 [Terfezia boudieri ATCC MYA-4762]|uniref:Uncharacterized protein n=1 Tax=Terfezia boudieri ATCC MYA-4762 TaxID=1051890 RepID=A0A3N4LN17_9PEZI|nr:hypothetical protein L211DRAFT_638185 [Terfezia boudieri ATCC MYA-4762]
MAPAPDSPSASENSLRTSQSNQAPSHLAATTATTTSVLCSACSAPTSNTVNTKATSTVDTETATPASGNGTEQELCGDSSDDSEDEELPPPADPDATGLKSKEVIQTMQLEFGNLLGEIGKKHKKKEEEKVVRERASKLEFKRLDELYNKNIHDFYLAESNAQSSQKEDKWEEYIFIIRRRFDWQNRYQKTFVDIKSNELKAVLKEVLDGIEGISLVEDKPTVRPTLFFGNRDSLSSILSPLSGNLGLPFSTFGITTGANVKSFAPPDLQLEPNLLFNYLPELETYLTEHVASEESSAKTVSHLKLLIEYIQADYGDIQKRLFPMLANAEITFELLWALLLPNSLLFTIDPGSGEDRMIKLDWVELRETPDRGRFYQLDCHYVEFDGKIFGEATCTLEIPEFRGVRKIDQLGVYPIQYHTKEETLKQKLIERGKAFCELKGMHYRMYKGIAYFKKKKGFVKVNINGRVMIDSLTFRRVNPNYRLAPVKDFDAGGSKSRNDEENEFDDCCGGLAGEDDDDDDDFNSAAPVATTSRLKSALRSAAAARRRYTIDALGKVRLIRKEAADKIVATGTNTSPDGEIQADGGLNPENMTEEDLLLCSPTVLGFSFSDKLWVELSVSHISDIEWNTGAFDSLVLPESQKRIVRALVESHSKQSTKKGSGFDDFIKGKGKGISEFLKKPLYCVGAGELGTDARTLELQLSKILDVAHVWGAVLLLDEADVFLERRSVHDLHRNALVSIFLRLLEYFQGILFLTTNRVETFDEAFQSRIHIALRYSDLDRKAKKQIWNSFLNIVAKDEASGDSANATDTPLREVVTKDELENLARRELNGRQIKNVVRTAQALAHNKGEKLGMEHLREVLEVTEGFERDLKGTGQLEGMMSYA